MTHTADGPATDRTVKYRRHMRNRSVMAWMFVAGFLGTVMALGTGPTAAADSMTASAEAEPGPEQVITVTIRDRKFEPPVLTLGAGRKTALILQNKDAELHAFLAPDLLNGVNLNVSGNGAPEFGPEGFKRVIIPSLGQAGIRFVPDRPGQYIYFCDMPGHEMKGTIIVQ